MFPAFLSPAKSQCSEHESNSLLSLLSLLSLSLVRLIWLLHLNRKQLHGNHISSIIRKIDTRDFPLTSKSLHIESFSSWKQNEAWCRNIALFCCSSKSQRLGLSIRQLGIGRNGKRHGPISLAAPAPQGPKVWCVDGLPD